MTSPVRHAVSRIERMTYIAVTTVEVVEVGLDEPRLECREHDGLRRLHAVERVEDRLNDVGVTCRREASL
jgi:hypothetical protein